MAAADSACQTHGIQEVQVIYRRLLLPNPAFSRVFSLSLSLRAHAALVALVALVGVCRVASIAPVACFPDDEFKPAERRKPLKFMGFFFSVENLPLCLHHTLQIHIRDCGEPEIFRNAPHFPPKNEKASKRFGTKPTSRKLHHVNNIASLIQTKLTSWPEMIIMFSLCNGWDCLPIDKFLNSWFENILTNLVPWTTSSKLHTSFTITLTRLEKSSYSCFKAIQN